ncbi:L-fucose:H+ symporter permease [Oxalobacteraceae bacterium A2-2]
MSEAVQQQRYAYPMVASLFFLWGFVHNLDPILIPHLRRTFSLSVLESSLVDAAVFLAYFLMALPAGFLVRRLGYQHTIVAGLLLFAAGCLLFIPAADTAQYALFLAALFVLACGLATLETAAHPYAALLGDPDRAAWRLNLAQSFNGLAAMLAPIAGARLLWLQGASEEQLQAMPAAARQAALAAEAASVKAPYLVLGLAIVATAVIFQRLRLPQAGGVQAGGRAAGGALAGIGRAWRRASIRRAVAAQFCYVGAQVCVFSFFILYAARAAGLPHLAAADYLGWGCGTAFMLGRFVGTWLMRRIEPARLLLAYALASAVLSLLAMFGSGMAAVYAVVAIAFFMSIMFPTIFSLGLRGAGPDTDMGSSLVVMSVAGGAVLPLLFGALSDATGNIQHGYAVPLCCFLVAAWFARSMLGPAPCPAAASSP